jgi:hypothetical protein
MSKDQLNQNSPLIGRFDQSFLIHMIRDFFALLVVVTVLEFTLKAGIVYYKFRMIGPDQVQAAADELSGRSCATKAGRSPRAPSIRSLSRTGRTWAIASPLHHLRSPS